MEKIFKETILISTKHISGTSLWYTHIRKILQKNYKILEIMQTHYRVYKIRLFRRLAKPMKYQKYEYIVATYPLHHLTDKKIIIFIPKR